MTATTASPNGRQIVTVTRQYGGPAQAELCGPHPARPNIIKVIYTDSRTAAWVNRTRIVEQHLLDTTTPVQDPAEVTDAWEHGDLTDDAYLTALGIVPAPEMTS